MDALQTLIDEHRVIEQVLGCLERIVSRSRRQERLDALAAREALMFLSNFADRLHHGKEEEVLFPLLEGEQGFSPGCGPTAVMRAEHGQGRMLLRGMIEALDAAADGDARAVSRFVQSAEEYTKLLQAHIRKEEHCLFPDVLRMLKPLHHEALLAAYRRIENQMGSDTREKLIRSADALAERLGAPRVRESTGATCGCGTDDGKTAQILPVLKPGGGTADSEQPFERPFIPSGI